MNLDELARNLQQLFSEKLKLNFDLGVFKDALGHLDQIEIADLNTYTESLMKFSSDDSVIRKMLEAVCSEKECGAQLTELLQRWNGIFPDRPVPVPTPDVLKTADGGLLAATVVLGILSASLLAAGIGYAVHKRNTGSLTITDHFARNVSMIDACTSSQDLVQNASTSTQTDAKSNRSLEALDLARDASTSTKKPLNPAGAKSSRSLEGLDLARDAGASAGKAEGTPGSALDNPSVRNPLGTGLGR